MSTLSPTSKFPGHKRPTVDTLNMIEVITRDQELRVSLYWVCGDNLAAKSEITGLPKKELKKRLALFEKRKEQHEKDAAPLLASRKDVAELLGISDAKVNELHKEGKILGRYIKGSLMCPADQFPDGDLIPDIEPFVMPLREAGMSDWDICDWLFQLREGLGGFSYAVLSEESPEHYRWVMNKVENRARKAAAERYILEKPSGASVDNVTPTSIIDTWGSWGDLNRLHEHAAYDDDWKWVAKEIQTPKHLLKVRASMRPSYPKDGTVMSISKSALKEKYGFTEVGIEAVTLQEDTTNPARVIIETFFNCPANMMDNWDTDAQEVGKALARLHEARVTESPRTGAYTCASIYEDFAGLGCVTLLEYAKVSDEHRAALVRFLTRSAEHLEAKNRGAAERKRQEAVMEDYAAHMREAEKAWLEANKDKLNGANRMFPPMMCHPHFM